MKTREEFREYLIENVIIDNNDCWIWQAGLMGSGYAGTIQYLEGKNGHRNSYRVFNGPIPKGLIVRHRCDVSNCINPDHILLGTYADNSADCISRGRQAAPYYGGRPHEISDAVVAKIKQMYSTGKYSYRDVAVEFNLSKGYAWKIVNGWYRS